MTNIAGSAPLPELTEIADGRWQQLPTMPPGTLAVVPGAGGPADALAVQRATLTVWQLADGQQGWTSEQPISVPIQYG